eukprot:scaffold164880_cov40-Cyclotella_meneghiniana.AAC.2
MESYDRGGFFCCIMIEVGAAGLRGDAVLLRAELRAFDLLALASSSSACHDSVGSSVLHELQSMV